jgi:predicted adenine nucleotide alpha hydrolase (AANH) superfamily ATPase
MQMKILVHYVCCTCTTAHDELSQLLSTRNPIHVHFYKAQYYIHPNNAPDAQ